MPPKKKTTPTRTRRTQKYIRNIRYVPVSVRISSERRIELAPRGQRGDTAPVSKDEMESQAFLDNLELVFEVVTESEAQDTIGKQTKNQQRIHPALSQMRNALGEAYERGVVVEENFTEQGKTVAGINDRGMITRAKVPGSEGNPLPDIPSDVPPEEVTDWLARQKNLEGPQAGIGDLKVTKEEPRKT